MGHDTKKGKEGDWNQALYMVQERITMRAHHLEELSNCFRRMHQVGIAEELDMDVLVLKECITALRGISTSIVDMVVKRAEESSRNVLNAALAGATQKKGDTEA